MTDEATTEGDASVDVVATPEPEAPVGGWPDPNATPDPSEASAGSDAGAAPSSAPDEASPAEEPALLTQPTPLNPDTWPDPNAGTVTDPDVLRQQGMPVPSEPEPEVTPTPEGVTPDDRTPVANADGAVTFNPPYPETRDDGGEWFRCLSSNGCQLFYTVVEAGKPVVCPTCSGTSVIRTDGEPAR